MKKKTVIVSTMVGVLIVVLIIVVGFKTQFMQGLMRNTSLSPIGESGESGEISVVGKITGGKKSIANASVQLMLESKQIDKTYRYGGEKTYTDQHGGFSFKESTFLSYFTDKIGEVSKPYDLFLEISAPGYLDKWVFESGESPKTISNGTWSVDVKLDPLPRAKSVKKSGKFSAYYYPGAESCANIGLIKLQYYYDKVKQLFGTELKGTIWIKFNSRAEQGEGDWLGYPDGVSTVCYPWTDNIEDPNILKMWDSAVPHELGHSFIYPFVNGIPYWANEGLAQYVSNTINEKNPECDSDKYMPIQDLTGENMPYYETAACFWKGLEKEYPGFVKNAVQAMKKWTIDNPEDGVGTAKNFIKFILKPVLINNYLLTESRADYYLNNYMTLFHYDENKNY